ncbi:DUF4286 family protein [Ferruginibacter yonginensis]|uniref:DUF4286 family protein n=1 Tax=Ferruginibacter yonginensis TaxID=1310416 RepID=A0ABV8QRI2_9BACT
MFVYNVTTKVTHAIATNWLQWLKEIHIPEIIDTGCFTNATVLQILEIDESEGPTYAVQYFAESKSNYNLYIEKFANSMRQKAFDKWGDQFIAFRTFMQIVD